MAAFTALEAIEMALRIERNGESFYKAAAARTADDEVRALFQELALQEQRHYARFSAMASHLGAAPKIPAAERDQYQFYVESALDNALFAGPDKALAIAEQAQDWRTALQAAVGFEKDALLFFYELRDLMSEADQGAVSAIIREEKTHLHRLAMALSSTSLAM